MFQESKAKIGRGTEGQEDELEIRRWVRQVREAELPHKKKRGLVISLVNFGLIGLRAKVMWKMKISLWKEGHKFFKGGFIRAQQKGKWNKSAGERKVEAGEDKEFVEGQGAHGLEKKDFDVIDGLGKGRRKDI